MWKAAFSGRSETASQKKKSSGSVVSSTSRDERRKSGKSSRGSTYDDYDEGSAYNPAPSSRVGEPRGLTESAVNALSRDDELDWEDEDKDARSERRSVKSGKSGRSERHRRKSERSRSREREKEREKTRKDEKRKSSSRRDSELSRGKPRSQDAYAKEGERAIPEMGSFEQFPGQYAGGMMGQAGQPDHMMSGGLTGGQPQAPNEQFGPTREDSFGAAASYYLDEGQSVLHQPGVRTNSPNMLVNPDHHLHAASLEAQPAADTGQGSAADFFNGDVVMTEEPQPINKPGKQPASSSSSASKPSKPGRTSSLGTAATATAALGMAGAAAVGSSSYHSHQHSSSVSSSYQKQSGPSLAGKPGRQPSGQISPGTITPQYAQSSKQQGANGIYYGPPPGQQGQGTPSKQSVNGTYYGTPTGQQSYGTPTGPGTDGSYYAPSPGRQSEAGAAAAGLAGYAAYEGSQHHKQKHSQSQYSQSQYGGTQYARPPGYASSAAYTSGSYADMQQRGYHEHKGPITKLKDGFLNLLSTEEDVAKMEMYTEAIGVCKHCFDPRTSPWDAPRRHHYHSHSPRKDSFEDLRRRRSLDKMRKHGSRENLAGRVDKDSRYYSSDSKRKSGSKADLAAAGLAGVGLAAGANALFNSGKDFEDTYSVKSGHRPSSAARRRSRSSSREQRRKSTHGVIGRDSKDEYAFVRTKDGRTERRRVHRSRSRSNDRRSNMMGAAAGAALGASAIAAGSSRRRHSRSRSRSSSPGLAGILGFSDSKSKRGRHSPDGSYYGSSQRPGREEQQSSGMFGGFFTSPPPKRRSSKREHRKKKAGFFNFGNGSSSSSDSEMAFGDGFSSKTNLPLRRKSSNKNVKRKGSDQRIAATVAGIGATATALAAAQKGNRISKRTSRPELGAKRRQAAQQDSSDGEWEDELPSDASSGSSLAFGDYADRLSRRQSKESMTSNGSGAGGLSAWGWRWGSKKDKKKRRVPSPPPAYPPRPSSSLVEPAAAAGAAALAAGAATKASAYDSRGSSMSGVSQQPMQYVDPRPVSEDSSITGPSRMPGGFDFDEPPVIRPGPAPLQQPKPVAPIQPAFTDRTNEDMFNDRPKPRRTMSSPTQSSFGMKDAALIGAAAIGTASIIASQSGRRSKEPKDVRFGLTEEQQAKEEREKRKEREKVERSERARADRERALKEEAERFTREQDVLRRREEENRRAAEAQIERERKFEQEKRDREAERERKEREAEALRESERQESYRQDEARKAEAVRRQDEARRKREAEIDAELEAKRRELEEEQRRSREKTERRDSQSGKTSERRDSQSDKKSDRSSSIPWGAVAAGTAAAATAGAVYAGVEHEREKDRERRDRDSYTAREITPTKESPELADHDVFDPAFFKRKRSPNRSPSGDRQIEEIARKAYEKIRDEGVQDYDEMIAEREDYYHEPQRSQVDVFAPKEILEHEAGYKEHAPDPMGGNDVRYVRDSEGHVFDDELYGPKSFERSRHAPFGVPKLGLIAPTPPPEVRVREKKRREQSPLSKSEVERQPEKDFDDDVRDTRSEPGGRKSSRSRSISWGEPQTHVYEPRTPESFRESAEGFFDAKDIAVGAAAAVAAATVGGAAVHASRDKDDEGRSPDGRNGKRQDDGVEEVIDTTDEGDGGYRKPFFESVSDLGLGGFNADSPGTEGAPPVRGYVEGEVDETPKQEKGPHIPGGWDDEQKDGEYFDAETAPSAASRDAPNVVEEPAWEPPLSKKDKKKRDKAAKRASTLEEELPTPPVVEPEEVPENSAPVEEEIPYEMLSKKDKKKRDKVKRASMLEEEMTTPMTPEPETIPEPTPPVEDEIPYEMLSKKEKKKRDKLKRGSLSEDVASPPPEPESEPRDVEPEPESAWEPPLSKKEQKKREKEAKKQGFADVAAAAMTTAGIAAVAGAATAEDDSESWDSPLGKKGKKGKKAKAIERDIRDIEPASDVMPGGWEAEKTTDSPPPETVDPFQFQVKDDSPPATTTTTSPDVAMEVDPMDEFADVKSSKKSKKKAKRDSLRFNEPEVSSPLRSELAFDEYMGAGQAKSGAEMPSISSTANGYAEDVKPADDERASRSTTYEVDDRPLTESPRRVSPDDLRSVASEPTGERERRRRSKSDYRPSEYYEEGETDPYDDVRSVAASEPADLYERRKSKRRSRTEDDDVMSTVSSRSTRREKDDEGKKEKKGGFFGLFGKKSSSPPSKSDGPSLSRTSTRDSKDGYDEDGERRHHRRKSEFGDDDDTRSVVSESRHRHHHRRRTDEEYPRATSESGSRPHHHRRRTEDDYNGSSGKDDTRDQSFLGMRVEGLPPLPVDLPASSASAAVKDGQGFGTPGSAERETVERGEFGKGGEGERVFQGPGETVQAVENIGEVERGEREKALRSLDGGDDLVAEDLERDGPMPGMVAAEQTTIPPLEEAVEYLPALPESIPGSPTEVRQPQTHTPQRPMSLQRPTSTTAVPLRFPFGQSPTTSGHGRMERAVSFGGHLPSTPPLPHHFSHVLKTRQGRPTSTEMMPLYLVERTRKTPEVEEMLPSLPSSKPSSRASSIVGSDEYESAVEEFNSPVRNRGLAIDTESANAGFAAAGEDYLDSQQTTPRASERPSDPFAAAGAAKTPKQQPEYWTWMDLEREQQQQEDGAVREKPKPQFYTWEDYERDEAWHRRQTDDSGPAPEPAEDELPALPPSRPQSRTEVRRESNSGDLATGVAAAALVGGTAMLGYNFLKNRDDESEGKRDLPPDSPTTEIDTEKPPLARADSISTKSKKKKGKKGKKQQQTFEDAPEQPTEASAVSASAVPAGLPRRDTDTFVTSERTTEEGDAAVRGVSKEEEYFPPPKPNALDRFLETEERLEEGGGAEPSPALPEIETLDSSRDAPVNSVGAVEDQTAPLSSPTDAEFFEGEQHVEEGGRSQKAAPEDAEDDRTESIAVAAAVGVAGLAAAAGLATTGGDEIQTPTDVKHVTTDEGALQRETPPEEPATERFENTEGNTNELDSQSGARSEQVQDAPIDDRSIGEASITEPTLPALEKQPSPPGHEQDFAAVPAPVEATTAVDVEAQPEAEFAPLLTRKQSKKSKKAQKKGSVKKALDDVLASDSLAESSGQETAIEENAAKATDESVGVEDAPLAQPAEVPSAVPTFEGDVADPGLSSTAEPTPETTAAPPDPEEEWETRPSISRKQSKKQKKKQKQRFDVFGEDEPKETQSEEKAMESVDSVRDETSPETAKEGDVPAASAEFDRGKTPTISEQPQPESVPLPDVDEEELQGNKVQVQPERSMPGDIAAPEPGVAPTEPGTTFESSKDQQAFEPYSEGPETTARYVDAADPATSDMPQPTPTKGTTSSAFDVQEPTEETIADEQPAETSAEQPEVSRDVLVPAAEASSTTPAAGIAQTATAEPEDEFAWSTSSKKKGKKGKKGKKAVSQALPWDEEPGAVNEPPAASMEETSAEPQTSDPTATDAGDRALVPEEPSIMQEPLELTQEPQAADAPQSTSDEPATTIEQSTDSSRGVADSEDIPPPAQSEGIATALAGDEDTPAPEQTPAGENEDADNFWAPTTSKKRKGKKGRKSAVSSLPDSPIVEEPTVAAQEDKIEGVAQPTETDSKMEPEMSEETAAPVSSAAAVEPDDFWAPPSSKIKKKSKKAAKSVDDYSAMEQEPSADTQLDVSNAEANEGVTEPIKQPVEASRDIAEPGQESTAPEEDFWAPLPSKKKKGKKAKKSGSSTPIEPAEASFLTLAEETVPTEEPEESGSTSLHPAADEATTEVLEDSALPAPLANDDQQATNELGSRSLDTPQQTDVSDGQAVPADPAQDVPLPEGDDDLATPMETAEPDPRPEAADEQWSATAAETLEPQQAGSAVDDHTSTTPPDTTEVREVEELINEQPPSIPIESSETPAFTTPAEEEEWALPVKKKKGKKGKKAQLEPETAADSATLPVDSTADRSIVPEEPAEAPTQSADPVEVDSWAPTTSKKKKDKKGKKLEPELEPPNPAEADTMHEESMPADPTEPASEQPSTVADPEEETTPAPDAEADQFWPTFSKKKKGKKGKKLDPDPAAERALETDTAMESQGYDEQNDVPQEPSVLPFDPAEPTSQPAAEEQLWPTTSKKSKKGKKGKSVQYDPPQDISSAREPTLDDSMATTEEPSGVPKEPTTFDEEPSTLVEEPRAVAEEIRETPAAEEDDFWTAPTSKKKRKGKKGKEVEQDLIVEAPMEDVTTPMNDVNPPTEETTAAMDDVIAPVAETTTEPDNLTTPIEDVTSVAPEEPWEEPTALNEENNEAQEQPSAVEAEDLWAVPSMKRKGKKGKKAHLEPETEQPSTRELPTDATADAIQPPPELPTETDLAEAKPSAEAEQDVWAAPSKKKKGKKGKRDVDASEGPEKGINMDEPSAQVGDSEPMDVDTAATSQDLPAPTVTEEPAADDPESFWTAPAKGKKGKKGKKAKRTMMEFDSVPEPESTPAVEDASDVPTGSAEVPVEFDNQARESPEDVTTMGQTPVDEPQQALPDTSGVKEQSTDLQSTADRTTGENIEDNALATPPAAEAVSDDTEARQTENTDQTSYAALTGGLPSDILQDAANASPEGEMRDQHNGPQAGDSESAQDNSILPRQEQPTGGAADDIDFGSFSKKSKKDKKKAKKANSASADPWTEDALEAAPASSWDDNAALATAGAVATGALGAVALAAPQEVGEEARVETQDEDWPTFTTKKSKDKRKAKKRGSATPATPLETGPKDLVSGPMDLDTGIDATLADAERELLSTSTEEPVSEPVAKDVTTVEPATEDRDPSTEAFPTEREADVAQETLAVDREPDPSADGQRDIDFTATVAAGLQDSGFNPDMVVNDPVFNRRATPPGGAGEADPEEVFESFSKKKKKKGKKGKQLETASDEPSRDVSGLQTPQNAANEFDEVLAKSLEGTGVDPAALVESNPAAVDPQSNELTGDGAEFSFATTRREKGKKKAQASEDQDTVEVSDTAADTLPDASTANDEALASDVRVDAPVEDATRAETGAQDLTAPAESQTELSRQLTVDTNTTEPTSALATTPGTPLLDSAADLVHAGERDMDVDDMDKAYRAYKRNKRKQKKQKWAALQAEESASETPQFTEAATPAIDIQDPGQTARGVSTEVADAVSGQLESQGIEQADFTPTEETEARNLPESKLPAESADGSGDYLHTSEVSQNLPTALDRTPSPDAEAEPHADDTQDNESRARSLSGAEVAGLGVAATAAAVGAGAFLARSSSRHRDRSAHSPRLESKRSLGLLPNDNPSPWSFDGLRDEGTAVAESPIVGDKERQVIRDSGYQETSSARLSRQSGDGSSPVIPEMRTLKSKESLHSRRSNEALYISTDTGPEWDLKTPKKRNGGASSDDSRTLHARTPSQNTQDTPLESTSRNRASYLFQTTPENLRSASLEGATPTQSGGSNAAGGYFPAEGDEYTSGRDNPSSNSDTGAFSPPPSGMMSPRIPLDTIPEEHLAHKRPIGEIDSKGPDHKAVRRTETPQSIRARETALSPSGLPPLQTGTTSARSVSNPGIDEVARTSDLRSPSVMSNRSNMSGNHWKSPDELRSYSRTSNRSNTPSLRRTSLSGDLRAASRRGETGSAVGARSSPKTIPFEAPPTPPSQDDEVMDAGASRSVDMSDVYQGYGDAQGSQVSPTRPPSMRKRQSMHIMDLESRLEQLAAENQALQSAKEENGTSRGFDGQSLEEALRARDLEVQQKDNEISQIRAMLQPMQEEIARLTEMNSGLTEANRNLVDDSNSRYATLQQEHAEAHEQWQTASRELDGLRQEHGQLTSGMRAAVEAQLASALASKNSEIRELREELDVATEKIRALQTQIQSTKGRDFLTVRDEDYFDGACQKLCQHVQQWVLRFSKVSDNRVCRLSTDLKDDKVEARLDNAVLDGSDVDKLLGDRVRRRDVFMSVVMTMVWEYVFTRYLFGMDREQRQKLKTLEKLLSEVGPPRAVAQWRATTLTLLAKRPAFAEQRDRDEQAVASEVFDLLCRLLPPPSSNEEQLLSSLQRVMHIAVDLSIEMRTQRSEYIMLPPLLPEYDTNGDLMHKVHFNASLMNERSGMFSSNEELEQSRAVVKIVLFPLVVKKGDEVGEGEEEIVVCPAQVLVHNDNNRGKKVVRVESGHMTIDDPRRSRQSLVSGAGSNAFG